MHTNNMNTLNLTNNNNNMNTQQVNVIQLINVKESTSKRTKCLEKTHFLKKEVGEKIEARTEKGIDRAVTISGIYSGRNLLDTYLTKEEVPEEEQMAIHLHTIANQETNLLMAREIAYHVHTGQVFTLNATHKDPKTGVSKKYAAIDTINFFESIGVLKRHSDHIYVKGIAREGQVYKKGGKGLSKKAGDIATYYIDTDFMQIHKDVWAVHAIKDHKIYWPDNPIRQERSKRVSEVHHTVKHEDLTTKILDTLNAAVEIKDKLKEWGLSVRLIGYVVDMICPGIQPKRKENVVNTLVENYGLMPQKGFGVQKDKHTKELEGNQCKDCSDVDNTIAIPFSTPIHTNIPSTPSLLDSSSSLPISPLVLPSDLVPESLLDLPLASPSLLNSLLPSSPDSLRSEAVQHLITEYPLLVEAYNQQVSLNLKRYVPSDVSDARQLEVMLAQGAFPVEYKLCSSNSPRVYSNEVDNLFYCRKSMRVAALENLGFMDVDLQSCHVQVALALWKEHLPLLESHVSNGSLWTHYEYLFTQAGLPFHKSFIKAMHHASLLGGGEPAYAKAAHVYNLSHPDVPLYEDTFKDIVAFFKQTDIYKELKALLKHLAHTFDGQTVTVLTGESFDVRTYKQHKVNGELVIDEGNLLTTISAILQSVEVTLLSYLILRCKELFVPVLWQHDGLTIKALYSNTLELMQEALDEYTVPLLGRRLILETTEL